jgi:putative spermidine/putrescine transport system substrate-binding protein
MGAMTDREHRLVKQQLSRRKVLRGAAAGAGVALAGSLIRSGRAQTPAATDAFKGRQMTFAGWGGAYQDVQKKAFCDPFSAAYGVTVLQDGPVDDAKTRAMGESGQPTWDVVDVTDSFLYNASQDGIFEPIDYKVVDRAALIPEYTHEFGVGTIVWSNNIGYNTEVFSGEDHPKSWADVFDPQKFPGKRTFPGGSPDVNLEVALMADGVPMDKLYPLDIDRAFAKFDTIKNDVIWWDTNSQSQQLFIDGEVNLGLILNGRAYDAAKKGAPIAVEWNGNIQSVDYFVVLKGSANADVAMQFIQFASQPEGQAMMANEIAYAPTNPAALKLVDPKVAPWLSTTPGNREKGILIDVSYWRDNLKTVSERWNQWLMS